MQKAGGRSIINFLSLENLLGKAVNSIYNASKFAVIGLTKAVAQEYAEHNVFVNSVHPGDIKTPGIEADDIKEVV